MIYVARQRHRQKAERQNSRTESDKSRLKLQMNKTSYKTLVKSNAAEFSVDCKTHES